MAKKLSLTIGIPAHNEERNIVHMLTALLKQKSDFFRLEKIIVMCDGCTDYTEPLARRISDTNKKVLVINDKKRKGKATRLNEIYHMSKSDIVVTIDADLLLDSKTVLNELLKPFSNPKVGLTTGFSYPMPAENISQRIIIAWYYLWYEARKRINNGNSVHNIHGALCAVRKELVAKIHFPANTIGTARYLYFSAITNGYTFRFVRRAPIRFYVPTSIKEYFIQTNRYGKERLRQSEIFGEHILQEYTVPIHAKLLALIASFRKRPLFTPFAILLYLLLTRNRNNTSAIEGDGIWTTISSTKRTIKPLM